MHHRIVKSLVVVLFIVAFFTYYNSTIRGQDEVHVQWESHNSEALMGMLETAQAEEYVEISEEMERRFEEDMQKTYAENKKLHEERVAQEKSRENQNVDRETILMMAMEKRDIPDALDASSLPGRALQRALTQIGKPYVWGAVGPDTFDCSGLVLWAYNQEGYFKMPRTTYVQWQTGVGVNRDEIQPGDLIYFLNNPEKKPVDHVGIYMGDGKMLHAPRPGKYVEITNVYWQKVVSIRRHAGE